VIDEGTVVDITMKKRNPIISRSCVTPPSIVLLNNTTGSVLQSRTQSVSTILSWLDLLVSFRLKNFLPPTDPCIIHHVNS
jgi:hypothetical protein